jgi:hypothetical protein
MSGTVLVRVAPDILTDWERYAPGVRSMAEVAARNAGGRLVDDRPAYAFREAGEDVLSYRIERP